MLIINADDWGRSRGETDAALACFREGRITSVTAMMFMQDSERAADLAKANGVDVGLHLNLSQSYDGSVSSRAASKSHERIVRFLSWNKYAVLIYHPGLRRDFRTVYHAQFEEFVRLYGKLPTHVDGHQHKHLCLNMLMDDIIPRGQKVRRSFSFSAGEKGIAKRAYRSVIDHLLAGSYQLTDFFFALSQSLQGGKLAAIIETARRSDVELMTHPCKQEEYACLMSDRYRGFLSDLPKGSYAILGNSRSEECLMP